MPRVQANDLQFIPSGLLLSQLIEAAKLEYAEHGDMAVWLETTRGTDEDDDRRGGWSVFTPQVDSRQMLYGDNKRLAFILRADVD